MRIERQPSIGMMEEWSGGLQGLNLNNIVDVV
jgi:hypothetical protein